MEHQKEKLAKLKKKFKEQMDKLKKKEEGENVELQDRVDIFEKHTHRLLNSLKADLLNTCPTKKETETMMKSHIDAIKIKIAGMEQQSLLDEIKLPEPPEPKIIY